MKGNRRTKGRRDGETNGLIINDMQDLQDLQDIKYL
jgi:hypothetical protein